MAEATRWREGRGNTSPAVDPDPRTYPAGAWRRNDDPVTAATGLTGWFCTVAGHPGTWIAVYGGFGGAITLRTAYLAGAVALDQTLPLSDADGGGVVLDATLAGFTGQSAFRINSAAGTAFAINRANGYVGISVAAPTAPLEIANSNGSFTSILLSQASTLQRIEKTSQGGLSIVVPNTAVGTNWIDLVMGSTSKIKIEPGNTGGPKGVITFNNFGVYQGTLEHYAHGETVINQQVLTGSSGSVLTLNAAAHTALTLGIELNDVLFNLARTVQQSGGNHPANLAFKILAPTYSATSATVITDAATVYINGAPAPGANTTFTRGEALWIGGGNGGGVRMDGFGATGLVKNINGGLLTLGVAGTDYMAPWSLTLNSIVVSGGGSTLVEDNANFYYLPAKHRAHSLTQTVLGGVAGVGQLPTNPTLTFNEESFDATETTGAFRDSGFYGVFDDCIGVAIGGYCSTNFTSQGVATYGLMTRFIYGGTEFGRDNDGALVIYGGSAAQLLGLQFRATAPYSATSGTQRAGFFNYVGYAGGFAPTSGTAKFRALEVAYEVEQSGGANGEVVGLAVTSTPTAVIGAHYGVKVNDGTTSIFRTDGAVASASSWIYIGESATGAITSLSGIQAFTNARSAQFYVSNSYGNAWHSNVQVLAPALTAAAPSFAIDTAGTSGIYGYSSTSLGVAADGRYVARFESTSVHRFMYLGELGTGITGVAVITFNTNSRTAQLYLDNTIGNALVSTVPLYILDTQQGIARAGTGVLELIGAQVQVDTLAGTGTQLVQTNSLGYLSRFTGTIPTSLAPLTGPAVVFTDASGNLTVDTANFVYNDATNQVLHPVGSASAPGATLIGDADTGTYRYAADSYAVAAGGRYVARFESTSAHRFLWLGEQGTGISGVAVMTFDTNSRRSQVYLDESIGNELICTTAFSILQTGLGIYRVGSGILGLAGTNVDVPSLSAGGPVWAAATTGRLSVNANLVSRQEITLSYGLDYYHIGNDSYGDLRTVAEGAPEFWMTPMGGGGNAARQAHTGTEPIEWPIKGSASYNRADYRIYATNVTLGGGESLKWVITINGTEVAASESGTVSAAGFVTGGAAVTLTDSDRIGLKIKQSHNSTGYLRCTAMLITSNTP